MEKTKDRWSTRRASKRRSEAYKKATPEVRKAIDLREAIDELAYSLDQMSRQKMAKMLQRDHLDNAGMALARVAIGRSLVDSARKLDLVIGIDMPVPCVDRWTRELEAIRVA